jgi:hypothetical protein
MTYPSEWTQEARAAYRRRAARSAARWAFTGYDDPQEEGAPELTDYTPEELRELQHRDILGIPQL